MSRILRFDTYTGDLGVAWVPIAIFGKDYKILASDLAGGGGSSRFGVSGEDDLATQERSFDLDNHTLDIINDGLGFSIQQNKLFLDIVSDDAMTWFSQTNVAGQSQYSIFNPQGGYTTISGATEDSSASFQLSSSGSNPFSAAMEYRRTVDGETGESKIAQISCGVDIDDLIIKDTSIVFLCTDTTDWMYVKITKDKVQLLDSLVSGTTSVKTRLNIGNCENFSNNAAALAGGLIIGDIYRNGDVLQVVH